MCENPIWLPDFCISTYIYRIYIFKPVVTNTFGIDSDVLCFKLQNRNNLKMRKKKNQQKTPTKHQDKSVPICYQNITSFFHNHMDYIDYTSWISHLLSKMNTDHWGKIRAFSWNNKSRRSRGNFKLKRTTGRYYQDHKLASTGHLHLTKAKLDLEDLHSVNLELQVKKCAPTETISRLHQVVWMTTLGSKPWHVA